MQGAGEDFFARAGFADYKCGYIGGSDLLQCTAHRYHLRAGGDYALDVGNVAVLGQVLVFPFQLRQPEGSVNHKIKNIGIQGLLVKIRRTHANRPDGVFFIFAACDHDHFGHGGEPKNLFQQRETFRRAARVRWQAQIQCYDIRLFAPECSESGFSV